MLINVFLFLPPFMLVYYSNFTLLQYIFTFNNLHPKPFAESEERVDPFGYKYSMNPIIKLASCYF